MRVTFEETSFEELREWGLADRKIFKKIMELIEDIRRSPKVGLGKPEILKHIGKGYWSRRITEEHRLIYKVESDEVIIIACKGHYV